MSETKKQAPRRKFLQKAAVGGAGAATLSFPMISQSQSTQTLRFQSTWPAKDIFHEYALDFAKKVNDMTGGELKIEVLPAGAVVPAFGLLDAVSKGTLDGGHGVVVYHVFIYIENPLFFRKNLCLWGKPQAFKTKGFPHM